MNDLRVPLMTNAALIEELKTLVEPGKVLTDAASLDAYGKDWTKHFAPAPSAIVFPKTVEQVQSIVRRRAQGRPGALRRPYRPVRRRRGRQW